MYYLEKRLVITLFSLFLGYLSFAQNTGTYRLKADITIKVKNTDDTFQFTKGKVFYDLNTQKIIYDIAFPEHQTYVTQDTLLYCYSGDTLQSVIHSPLKPEFSVFHFILNGHLADFGLHNSHFSISNVEKIDDLIVTTWSPPPGVSSPIGEIFISTKDKKLHAVLIHDPDGQIMNRQIFKNYAYIDGANIPQEILSVSYIHGQKMYQIIQFDHVILNEDGNNEMYDFQTSQN